MREKKFGSLVTFSWASCCETWLKNFKSKFAIAERKRIRDFCLMGSYPLVGHHVVKHGLNFKVEVLRCRKKKVKVKKCLGRGLPR